MKKVLVVIGIWIFWVSAVTVSAAGNQDESAGAVYEARNGILQVNLSFADDRNESHVVQGGSGFLIGNEDGAEYLITNYHCLNATDELREKIAEEYALGEDEKNSLSFQIQVVVKRDIVVDATVVTGSEAMDFAVLRLSQMIYDRTPMVLNTDSDTVMETSQVYTLGFPEDIQEIQDISFYTKDDVSIMNGIVSKKTTVGGVLYIQHSAVVSEGNCGGPLLNEAGQVIGMNRNILEDGYFYSVHISEITSVLDALGIPYIKSEKEEEAVQEVLAEESVIPDTGAMEEEDDSFHIILLIGGISILVLLVLVIVLLILVIRKGDKKPAEKEEKEKTGGEKDTVRGAQIPIQAGSIGGGETTVLNSDASEDLITATLINSKSNEKILVNRMVFYLGKDGLKADYCVKNNPSVSRTHAVIKQTGGGFYLEDLQATNGTFHNGRKLQPSQSVRLSNGDRIRLANEEFIFQL